MSGFDDMHIQVVEPGYEVDGPDGKKIVVGETGWVSLGRTVFITKKVWSTVKAQLAARPSPSQPGARD